MAEPEQLLGPGAAEEACGRGRPGSWCFRRQSLQRSQSPSEPKCQPRWLAVHTRAHHTPRRLGPHVLRRAVRGVPGSGRLRSAPQHTPPWAITRRKREQRLLWTPAGALSRVATGREDTSTHGHGLALLWPGGARKMLCTCRACERASETRAGRAQTRARAADGRPARGSRLREAEGRGL